MTDWRDLPTFSTAPWQMPHGERAVLEGLLAQARPKLAIEIGTAEGGSLRRIAAHSERVISFDLVEPAPEVAALPNVELRTGDSHALLPEELRRLERDGEHVDFALVDGDHSAEGVRRDIEDLLASDALRSTIIVLHDTINEEVRRGLDAVDYAAHPKVRFVDLDFCPGKVAAQGELRGQCWNGLGVIVLGNATEMPIISDTTFLPMPAVVWEPARAIREGGPDPESAAQRVGALVTSAVERGQAAVERLRDRR